MFDKRMIEITFNDGEYVIDKANNLAYQFQVDISDLIKSNKRVIINEGTITNIALVFKNKLIFEDLSLDLNDDKEIFTPKYLEIDKEINNYDSKSTIFIKTFIYMLIRETHEFRKMFLSLRYCYSKECNALKFNLVCYSNYGNRSISKAIIRNLINNYKLIFDLNIEYYSTEE